MPNSISGVRGKSEARARLAADSPSTPAAGGLRGWQVIDYDLAATLDSGQAFRWTPCVPNRPTAARMPAGAPAHFCSWEGIVRGQWVRLEQSGPCIAAQTALPTADWRWLEDYLGLDENLADVLTAFPDDPPLRDAVAACRGLRLLRQEPWECLASFILSSTKQIVQIRQIVDTLCRRFGEPVPVPPGHPPAFAFPTPQRLAACAEADLRACKAGFRAPYLRASAQRVAAGDPDLGALAALPLTTARERLLALPGVGRKIADCALLFSLGFRQAFPVDVWVLRALRELYFPRRRVPPRRLREFSETHFGPQAGYAQQYLFHYRRTRLGRRSAADPAG